MKKAEINAKLTEHALEMAAASEQAKGLRNLYSAAAMRGDNKAADQQREALHNLLDQELDAKAVSCVLIRALASAKE